MDRPIMNGIVEFVGSFLFFATFTVLGGVPAYGIAYILGGAKEFWLEARDGRGWPQKWRPSKAGLPTVAGIVCGAYFGFAKWHDMDLPYAAVPHGVCGCRMATDWRRWSSEWQLALLVHALVGVAIFYWSRKRHKSALPRE